MVSIYRKIRSRACGRGGYKCPCCGPSPRRRKPFKRMLRRRIKQILKKIDA